MTNEHIITKAVEEGGSYEVIKKRLQTNKKSLIEKLNFLNETRIQHFGSLKQEVLTNINVHSEHNSIPVDMIEINDLTLIGYNVSLGMKTALSVEDMFDFYKMEQHEDIISPIHVPIEKTFLNHPEFIKSFDYLTSYYKDAKLLQFIKNNNSFLMVFQLSVKIEDLKIFKFSIDKSGDYVYSGEGSSSDILDKFKNNFENWTKTSRNDFVQGKHPHVSINNKLFVETIGGDLTIKIENNTDDGRGIYSEPVSNSLQNLEDSDIQYIDSGENILLKIKPYQEKNYRYFIFNCMTQQVVKVEGIGVSCVSLPEDHGFIFSNGYYLKSGELKQFDVKNNFYYLNNIKSPNGEDYLYVFFDPIDKVYVLYPYNLVNKKITAPIFTNGYSLHSDGLLYIMKAHVEPQKIHSVQVWTTPFLSEIQHAQLKKSNGDNFYTRIGNADLVRCVSDIYTIVDLIDKNDVSTTLYESIIKFSTKLNDTYHWLDKKESFGIKTAIQDVIDTSILVLQEFEKVISIQKQATETLFKAQEEHKKIIAAGRLVNDKEVSKYIDVLSQLKTHLGQLITFKEQKYIDVEEIDKLQKETNNVKDSVNEKIIQLLQKKESFDIYHTTLNTISISIKEIKKVVELQKQEEQLEKVVQQITLVNDEINDITFKDPSVVADILNNISNIFAMTNQLKATIKNIKKELLSSDAKIEFSSQFKLLSQSVSSALTLSDTIDKCDEQKSKVLNKLETLETKFSDFEDFMLEITKKREEIVDIFENHKQQLINEKQKRVNSIIQNATLTLDSIKNRILKIIDLPSMNTFFASDSLVLKYQQSVEQLKNLGDNTKSDDLFAAFKNVKDQSLRQLRDTQDIFEDNGNVMKMGKHRFSVNKTPVELTLITKDSKNFLHITSTDFYHEIENNELIQLKDYLTYSAISESKSIYRSEYLAYSVLQDAILSNKNISLSLIEQSIKEKSLQNLISDYSADLYKEGYIKGIHDHDAALILEKLYQSFINAGILKYSKISRIIAALSFKELSNLESVKHSHKNAILLKNKLGNLSIYNNLVEKCVAFMQPNFDCSLDILKQAADVFLEVFDKQFSYSSEIETLYASHNEISFLDLMNVNNYQDILDLISIVQSIGKTKQDDKVITLAEEIVYFHVLKKQSVKKSSVSVSTLLQVDGLLGQHERIQSSKMNIELEDLIHRAEHHKLVVIPSYEKITSIKNDLLNNAKQSYRMQDFKAKPLSSFVRNKLISESYLQLIGDNLAKQMGTLGEKKRTDLMGMLLLISPPGYGKTTIIEYIAQKLGLVFVKINCPSLGHSITSLDPAEATDATSRKEIEKINLAFEMGNNVMLYLDDIQHTNPEFLQKFISLCDGSRKVDGVWNGQPKTYDFKGKKFSIVMAGNPYTESGEVFKIPDMLSNRADIYNLGDMLSGQTELFELSYIENSLTANSVLAPLANRTLTDLYKFIDMAKGKHTPLNEFEHSYSQAEATEIVEVLKRMIQIQKVVLKVNQEYIKSAATGDKYRTEPPFKLQGSYRNMNKMSEKIVSAMNESEVQSMILDHYLGEAQTLTAGTEENLLKLKEVLNVLTQEEQSRLEQIRRDFTKNKSAGSDDLDGFSKISLQLNNLVEILGQPKQSSNNIEIVLEQLKILQEQLKELTPDPEKDKSLTELFNSLNSYILSKTRNKQ